MSDYTRYDLPKPSAVIAALAATHPTCPDCNGRGWRRQVGAFACACLAGQLHTLTAQLHTLTARVAALEAQLGEAHDV